MNALHILALNSGSSSLKFGVYRVDAARAEKLYGQTLAKVTVADAQGAIARVAASLAAAGLPRPDAVGHRLVHGGAALRQHIRLNEPVKQQLLAAADYAPLHTPAALALVDWAQQQFPDVTHVACLDTAFHAGLPEVARVLPIARQLLSQGMQRYGFHGLSLESIVRQLGPALPPRLVIAHLGQGASVSALQAGRSIDTSMGMTPSGGVLMGTRCGDLDPGVFVRLMHESQLDAHSLRSLLDESSGMLAVSGLSGDMRQLHAAAPSSADARLAIEMFGYAVRKQVAAMAAVLGGIDMLVFTGGIGENDASVRSDICRGLGCVGLSLDEARNRAAINPLNGGASRCEVRVIGSQEDEQIALHTQALCT